MRENLSLDVRLCRFLQLPGVADLFCVTFRARVWRGSIALGVYVRREQEVRAVGRPEFSASLRRHCGQPLHPSHRSRHAVEIGTPDLPSAFLRGEKREAFAVRRPARTIRILSGDDLTLLASRRGNNPEVWSLGVGLEIYINHAENHPLPVGRNFGLAHALQFHHVFECEGMFGLGKGGKSEGKKQKGKNKTAHEGTSSANR